MGFIKIGRLRSKVTFQRKSVTRSSTGADVDTWNNIATVWAQVKTMSGGEQERSDQRKSLTTYDIVARFRDDLRTADRILFEKRTFDILAINNMFELNSYLIFTCEEIK